MEFIEFVLFSWALALQGLNLSSVFSRAVGDGLYVCRSVCVNDCNGVITSSSCRELSACISRALGDGACVLFISICIRCYFAARFINFAMTCSLMCLTSYLLRRVQTRQVHVPTASPCGY